MFQHCPFQPAPKPEVVRLRNACREPPRIHNAASRIDNGESSLDRTVRWIVHTATAYTYGSGNARLTQQRIRISMRYDAKVKTHSGTQTLFPRVECSHPYTRGEFAHPSLSMGSWGYTAVVRRSRRPRKAQLAALLPLKPPSARSIPLPGGLRV